jgi:hypothetical protein
MKGIVKTYADNLYNVEFEVTGSGPWTSLINSELFSTSDQASWLSSEIEGITVFVLNNNMKVFPYENIWTRCP